MKNLRNTIVTILAAVILVIVGMHLSKENKKRNIPENMDEPMFVEVVTTEKGEIEIESEKPLIESFSNAVSNANFVDTSRVDKPKTSSLKVINNPVEKKSKPFTFGIYFLDVLNKHGAEKCTSLEKGVGHEKLPKYNEDNFKLEDISIVDNSVYLFVDAEESPKSTCATIVEFKNMTSNIYDAIRVIVE